MSNCRMCAWESLTTTWDDGSTTTWRRAVWLCPDHAEVVVPAREAVLELPPADSPLLDGPAVDGVVVERPPD